MAALIFKYTRPNNTVPFWHEYAQQDPDRLAQYNAYHSTISQAPGVISISRELVSENQLVRTITVDPVLFNRYEYLNYLQQHVSDSYRMEIMSYYEDNNILLETSELGIE